VYLFRNASFLCRFLLARKKDIFKASCPAGEAGEAGEAVEKVDFGAVAKNKVFDIDEADVIIL